MHMNNLNAIVDWILRFLWRNWRLLVIGATAFYIMEGVCSLIGLSGWIPWLVLAAIVLVALLRGARDGRRFRLEPQQPPMNMQQLNRSVDAFLLYLRRSWRILVMAALALIILYGCFAIIGVPTKVLQIGAALIFLLIILRGARGGPGSQQPPTQRF
jgi:hypothetical protein